MEKQGLKFIGSGTEGDVYTNGQKAYKFMPLNCVGSLEDVRSYIGISFPNVVQILDAYINPECDREIIIVMELLEELKYDSDLMEEVRISLWDETYDLVDHIKHLIKKYRNKLEQEPELLKMLKSIIKAGKQLNRDCLDIGFHNLMYCTKTNEYKQIDIF